jgi:superfamily I DNA/RNA helicase
MISITDDDLQFAEGILLKPGQHFDTERINFIKNLNTIDLQAVPGSGKTTALLAKLLILERYMPLAEGRGVLVLSHTNIAVNEIKDRIGKYCPRLFSYPNFIGTIQSFVNVFLASPYYLKIFKRKPLRIDAEIYRETISNILSKRYLPKFDIGNDIKKISHVKNARKDIFYKFRFGFDKEGNVILTEELNGEKLSISKPGASRSNYTDYSDECKKELYKWFEKFKKHVLAKYGVLHHDDAYFLANFSVLKNPQIKILLQARFQYLFVDEMQDMDVHQHDLLESIFFCEGVTQSIFQRIGDRNQAIYNKDSVKLEDIWKLRTNCLNINGSYRLNSKLASLVQNFGLTLNTIDGRRKNTDGSEIDINPTIIIYNDSTKEEVISTFAHRIKELQDLGKIDKEPPYKFMAVGWRKKEHKDASLLALSDYWPRFSQSTTNKKIDHSVLRDYIPYDEVLQTTLEPVYKNLLNALLKILRLENIQDEKGRFYRKNTLIRYLKALKENEYRTFRLTLYKCAKKTIKGNIKETFKLIKDYIDSFLGIFGKSVSLSYNFINGESEVSTQDVGEELDPTIFKLENVTVELGTVHSVKGQTHTATLYLETHFYKACESKRLATQILGSPLPQNAGNRVKQSAKMAYVGFSRPTHLLCIAVHKDRFDQYLSNIDKNEWDVIDCFVTENTAS